MLCFTAPEGRTTAHAAGTATTAQPYARHVAQRTLLYALVQAHYPDFLARLEAEERSLPAYVREEFEAFLHCGVLDHGFLRVVCDHCHAERLVAFSCKKCGFSRVAARGAWPRVRGTWWKRCSVRGRCGSGC